MGHSSLELCPEEVLLVSIAETVSQTHEIGNIARETVTSLLDDNFDWCYFLTLSGKHRYHAAVYQYLSDRGLIDRLPVDVKHTLQREYLLAQARFIKKESELCEVLQGLEARNIEPIVFKGIPQAYLLYRDPGIRLSYDIDILVEPSELEAAQQVLNELGYTIYLGDKDIEYYRDYHFHYIFTRGEQMDSVLELHWNLLDPKKDHGTIDISPIRSDCVTIKVRDREMRTLHVSHVLWYTCVHASYRSFFGFRDLAELKRIAVRLDRSEWERVFSWAERCGTMNLVSVALRLTEKLFGAYLGPEQRRKVAVGFSVETFALSTYYPRGLLWEWVPFSETHVMIMAFFLRKGIRQKLEYLFRLVVPHKKSMYEMYFVKMDGSNRSTLRHVLRGIYVLSKVLGLSLVLGFLIQTGIIGEKKLDPWSNEVVQRANR